MKKVVYDPILGNIKMERSMMRQVFSATGGQTQFTVTEYTVNADDITVIYNGAVMEDNQFSVAGQVITINPAAVDGDEIIILN